MGSPCTTKTDWNSPTGIKTEKPTLSVYFPRAETVGQSGNHEISSIHKSWTEILIVQSLNFRQVITHPWWVISDMTTRFHRLASDWKSVLAHQQLKKTFNKTLNKHKKNFWLRIFEFVKLQFKKWKKQRPFYKTETDMSDDVMMTLSNLHVCSHVISHVF